jgi:hypothetical protein
MDMGSNFAGEGKDQASMNMEERRGQPPRGCRGEGAKEELLLLFMVVTPSSWW